MVKGFNVSKARVYDRIPLNLTNLSANVVDKCITSIINMIFRYLFYLFYLVRPIYKEKNRQNKENYHPMGILDRFSKSVRDS